MRSCASSMKIGRDCDNLTAACGLGNGIVSRPQVNLMLAVTQPRTATFGYLDSYGMYEIALEIPPSGLLLFVLLTGLGKPRSWSPQRAGSSALVQPPPPRYERRQPHPTGLYRRKLVPGTGTLEWLSLDMGAWQVPLLTDRSRRALGVMAAAAVMPPQQCRPQGTLHLREVCHGVLRPTR